MALWEDVKKNLVEWYSITSDKTTEVARVGSRRWDKFGISRDIERQFSELGSLVYVGLKEGKDDFLEDEALLGLVTRIEKLEEELILKNEEINNIKSEYARDKKAEQAAAAAAGGGADSPVQEAEVTETVITDPVLEVGAEDSAILVEPMAEAVTEDIEVDIEVEVEEAVVEEELEDVQEDPEAKEKG